MSVRNISVGDDQIFLLARKLRAKSEWEYQAGWYSTEAEQAANSAKREILADIAELLDETFDFDSCLTPRDFERRRNSKDFSP